MMDAMGWLTRFGRRMLMLLRHGQLDADLQEEMRLHRDLRGKKESQKGSQPKKPILQSAGDSGTILR